jgi:hypothetical protein
MPAEYLVDRQPRASRKFSTPACGATARLPLIRTRTR